MDRVADKKYFKVRMRSCVLIQWMGRAVIFCS